METISSTIVAVGTDIVTAAPAVIGAGLGVFALIMGVRKLKTILRVSS